MLSRLKKLVAVLSCDKDPSLTGKLIYIGSNKPCVLPIQFSFCSNCSSLIVVPLFIQARTRVKLNFLDSIAKFWELQVKILRTTRLARWGNKHFVETLTRYGSHVYHSFWILKNSHLSNWRCRWNGSFCRVQRLRYQQLRGKLWIFFVSIR